MKILADQNIACVAAAFGDLGELQLMPGREIRREHLRDCQCLIVRTVTRVDADLLRDTPVEFVGTATIGTDHLDLQYLNRANIRCTNAAGCNAEAAAEYVVAGLFALSQRYGFDPTQLRAGIVGFGNVGSRLHRKLKLLGIECLVTDPPLAAAGHSTELLVDLDTLLTECNFISLHVPLTRTGQYPTYHLLNDKRLKILLPDALLVNAARGEVVDNKALLERLSKRSELRIYLDTWENEPKVCRELLQKVDLATPHIAGYSVEGRLRGTQMVLAAVCDHFGLTSRWQMERQLPKVKEFHPPIAANNLEFWQSVFAAHCNIWRDHDALVGKAQLDEDAFAAHFDALRKNYPERLEYERFRVAIDTNPEYRSILEAMGFQTTA